MRMRKKEVKAVLLRRRGLRIRGIDGLPSISATYTVVYGYLKIAS